MSFKNALAQLTLATGLVSLGALPAYADLGFLEPAQIARTIKKEVAKQSIGTNVNLVNADIFEGISAALKYRIQSEPSYVDGFYTRLDRYTLSVDINPGDIIEELNTPIGFGINKNAEIIFARQFKSQTESLTALPYTLKNIPLTAQTAIRELQVGDFVSLQTRLSFVVSLGASSPLGPQFSVSGSTHAYISGDFYIHLFRMPNNHIRVKLIGIRGKGGGAGAQVGVGSFKVLGFNYLDKKISRWLDLTPLALNISKSNNDVFMIDYVFDLDNSQAAQSYDHLMLKKTRFKDLTLVSPLDSTEDLKSKLLTDLSDIEEMSYADRNLPPESRRVDRVFKGSNSSEGTGSSFRFGLNLLKLEKGKAYAQNRVAQTDRNEEEKKYLLDTFSITKKVKMLFGLFGDETVIGTNLLFSSDNQWRPTDFIALTLSREIKMKDVTKRDYRKVQEHVRRIIPAEEYAKIDWKNWDFSEGRRVNGFFKNQIFFHPEALAAMPVLTKDRAYKLFYDYVAKSGIPAGHPHSQTFPTDDRQSQYWLDSYEEDMRNIASYLSVVFSAGYAPEERHKNFVKMKDYTLWQERGAGFMLSLIPKSQLGQVISYEMTFSAKGVETISAKFGNFKEEELYKSLMYIQSVINNRSFDLRLYTDEKGEFQVR